MEETKEKQSRCECLDFNMFANAGKDRVVRFVIATENLEGELVLGLRVEGEGGW